MRYASAESYRRVIDAVILDKKSTLLASVHHGKIRRQDQWTLDYLELPYLRDCADSELVERFNDIQANLCTVNQVGQIGIGPPGDHFWLSRLTHVFEEFGLRGGMPTDIPNPPHFPKFTHPHSPNGCRNN